MKRRMAREKALQALFQIDVSEVEQKDAIEHVLDGAKSDPYLERLVTGTIENLTKIDETIGAYLENWTMDRLATVDRNLLRLSTYELLFYQDEVPTNVVLDEAIEIAKIYGDEKSSSFINGVLSKVKETK